MSNTQKRLNQYMQKQFPEWTIDCISMQKINNGVREWLLQKRQEVWQLHKCNGFCAECLEEHGTICDEIKVFDELLKEL